MPARLNDMPLERANCLFLHPIHQDGFAALVYLVEILRQCNEPGDYHIFQEDLLEKVLAVQTHRNQCNRVAKLLRQGKGVPADAPELRSTEPATDPETWALEAAVCERVDRQLRSVADAMAWRLYGYDRSPIIALAGNQHPGPMAGKKGLQAERDFVTSLWCEEGRFALLHDLTTCLRIADVSWFDPVDDDHFDIYLHEVKTNTSRRVSTQSRRQRQAHAAIHGGSLPGDSAGWLVPVHIPYKTHLNLLADAFTLAQQRGVAGIKVPGGRALLAADLRRGYGLWSEADFIQETEKGQLQTLRRAHILGSSHRVFARSDDVVGHFPTMPPWASYPLEPVICASLIMDMAIFVVTLAGEPIVAAIEDAGLRAEWVLPSDLETISRSQVVVRISNRRRVTEMRWSELQQRLLFEMVDVPTWIDGVKELMARDDLSGHPWLSFKDEWNVWM